MAGGAWDATESADTRRQCSPENSGRDAGRSALSFTRTRPARYLRKKRRPLCCRANKHSEKNVGARTRDQESTDEAARELTCFCHSDRSGRISRYFSQFTSIGREIMRDVETSLDMTGMVRLYNDRDP